MHQLFFEYRYILWKVDVHQSEIGTIQNVLEDASEIMWKLEDELKFLTEFSSDLPDNVDHGDASEGNEYIQVRYFILY